MMNPVDGPDLRPAAAARQVAAPPAWHSPAQDVYERASTKTQARPCGPPSPCDQVQEAVQILVDRRLCMLAARLRAQARLRAVAQCLVESQPAAWEEVLAPLTGQPGDGAPALRRTIHSFWGESCGEQLCPEQAQRVRWTAIKLWNSALLRAVGADACNLQNKRRGLMQALSWTDQAIAAGVGVGWRLQQRSLMARLDKVQARLAVAQQAACGAAPSAQELAAYLPAIDPALDI